MHIFNFFQARKMIAMELSPGSEWFQQLANEENILKQQLLDQFTDDLFDETLLSAAQHIHKAVVSAEKNRS